MARKRKAITTRKRSHSAPAVLCVRRSEKRKAWSDTNMKAAMKAVAEGVSVSQAAKNHGVPKTTLYDRISGRVVHGVKPGPRPYLSPTEEKELGQFLKDCAKVGYGKTRKDVLGIAQSIASDKGLLKSTRVSEGWWRRFLERQADLSLRQGDSTAHVRMDAINSETIDQYFSLLHDTLSTHELLDKPAQIYNVDESGMPLNPRPPKVVTAKGRVTKKVRYRTSGRKGQITIVACANAIGQAIPPMIIYDAAKLNPAWTKNEVTGTKYGLSSNGWINSDLFEGWLVEHFVEHAVSARPLFLLLDGHSTHYQPRAVQFAKEHDIIMLCLPPHTTHESQPLDVGVFAPLKTQWTKICHDFYQANPGRIITRFHFSHLFAEAWYKSVTPLNVMAGFRKAGVFPFNPKAIAATSGLSTSPGSSGGPSGGPSGAPACSSASGGSSGGLPGSSSSPGGSSGAPARSSASGGSSGAPARSSASPGGSSGAPARSSASPSGSSGASGPPDRTPGPSNSSVCPSSLTFTPEQLDRFQIRFEEGFDVYEDSDYVQWLQINHPEAVPADRYTLVLATTNGKSPHHDPTASLSLTEHFSNVTPITSVTDHVGQHSPGHGSNTHSSAASSSGRILPSPQNSTKDNVASKYLVLPGVSTPSGPKIAPPRARLLTSSEALAIIEEKERKKQQEAEEKEQRKKEREQKKIQREERKKKAEERARKAEEKAQEKVRKAEEKARRAEVKAQKVAENTKSKTGTKRKVKEKTGNAESPSTSGETQQPQQKKARTEAMQQVDNINDSECCMCFTTYEEDLLDQSDRDWVACACGRWLHEDCAEDCIVDSEGKERLCHFCLDVLA